MVPFFWLLIVMKILSTSLASDHEALLTLKQGFESPSPAIIDNWSVSTPICSWAGVRCSQEERVVALNLSSMNLYGHVSVSAISRLEMLSELNLDGNNFTGEFSIDGNVEMGSLRFLNISNNQFSGALQWNFSSVPNLEVLDTYNNNFSGDSLPLGVLFLKKLRHLDFGGNYFDGEVPKPYGDMVGLEFLNLGGNNLHGNIPPELGNLTNLRELYLGYFNSYEGGIPKQLANLRSLEILDLTSCDLDGSIPPQLGNLENLQTLYLDLNFLSGPIPGSLGNLSSLTHLDLSHNVLTGEIPYEFIGLKGLILLNLFMNRLHGSIPDFVAGYPNLEVLYLWKNNFTGIVPQNLGQNGKLHELDLSTNKLTGTIPKHLCASRRLRILILFKNFLFGAIPEDLGSCSSLVRVRLGQNYLNGSIPGDFIYLPDLNLLELHNNLLSGSLAEKSKTSSNSTKIAQLILSNNQIMGLLPSSLFLSSSLQTLSLSGNKFSGPIPPSIGQLQEVVKVDLSQNSFSGEIPVEIGECLHLTYLDLSQNNFSGSIPAEISSIKILSYLNLSRNHLDSSIPLSFGSLKSLTTADFSFNDLAGKLPESGQFAFFNASSFAGNPSLCGALISNPCNATDLTGAPSGKPHSGFKLIFAIGMLLCSLVFATAAIVKARSFKKTRSSTWKMTAFQSLDFSVSDVLECVKDGNVIGRGGAGVVYHGKMPNGVEIAVKKLLGFSKSHDHGFRAEIKTLGNIRHRYIVKLLAFCSNSDTNLLVYEYMRNGSLGEALHGKKGGVLRWQLRYKVAVEAAKGLCYLHHDCSPLIVHRDVKSNNILLNSGFEAHVADFGLAKFLVDGGGASECMSAIAGSYGYIAPEYAYTLKVDEKSDVYSYGVVLLELITGRRPVGEFGEGVDIVQWARTATNCRREEVDRIVDPRLTSSPVPKEEAQHLFFIAMLCIQENSVERPTMREVVQMLSEYPRQRISTVDHHQSCSSSGISCQQFHKRDPEMKEKVKDKGCQENIELNLL